MNTDPIADLLTRIRNAQNANHAATRVPHSKIKENIVRVMIQYGFLEKYEIVDEKGTINKDMEITLKENRPRLTLKRISSPGQRIYKKAEELKTIKSGLGISILSTEKGIISNVEAKKQNIGGEILCEIY